MISINGELCVSLSSETCTRIHLYTQCVLSPISQRVLDNSFSRQKTAENRFSKRSEQSSQNCAAVAHTVNKIAPWWRDISR